MKKGIIVTFPAARNCFFHRSNEWIPVKNRIFRVWYEQCCKNCKSWWLNRNVCSCEVANTKRQTIKIKMKKYNKMKRNNVDHIVVTNFSNLAEMCCPTCGRRARFYDYFHSKAVSLRPFPCDVHLLLWLLLDADTRVRFFNGLIWLGVCNEMLFRQF